MVLLDLGTKHLCGLWEKDVELDNVCQRAGQHYITLKCLQVQISLHRQIQ